MNNGVTAMNFQQRIQNPPKTTLTVIFVIYKSSDFTETVLRSEVPVYYIGME